MCGRYVSVAARADLLTEFNATRAEGAVSTADCAGGLTVGVGIGAV